MKIANKISLSFLITGVILTTVATSIFYTMAKNDLGNAILDHLKTTAQSRARHIETFLREHKHAVELLSSENLFIELLSTSKDNPEYNKKLENVSSRINKVVKAHKGLSKISLLDKDGIVAASSDEACVGSDKSADKIYFKAKEATCIRDMYISKTSRIPAMDIGTPVFLNGEFLGVIIADLAIEELFKITLDRTGLGETGEIYLINKDAYMISHSIFKEDVILNQKVDTINARNALMHKDKEHIPGSKEIAVFPDYRGVSVLGTHTYIPEMQWSLLAEIDEKEALAPLGKIRLLFIIILVVVPICAWLVGVFVSRMISRPIYRLHKGTQLIGQGDLDYKVGIDSKDEIGQLSEAFNKMAEDLKKTTTSINDLNKEIADRKKAEESLRESEEKFRTITASAMDAIIMIDNKGNATYWNEAAEKIFGYSNQEIMDRELHPILAPKRYHEAYKTGLSKFKTTGRGPVIGKTLELMALKKDGTEFPIELSVSAVKMKGKWNAMSIIREITARKEAEEELRQAKEEAEAASRAKTEFLAGMSHEIRTPMNAIIGMADLLWETPLAPEQRQYVQVFRAAGENLLEVINDILDISKVEAGHLDLEEIDFDLGEIVEKACEVIAFRAHERGLELACHVMPDFPTELVGDPVRLHQVLINLIGNAIKFTEKGEVVVEVKRHSSELRGEGAVELIFSVADTGIGIPPEKVDSIFDIFRQADSSTTRKHGGTGLGLTISKRLVELMGGRIWVESKVGRGSTFYFTAKFEVQAEPKRYVQPPPVDMKGLKTLVVDDNATNRMILRKMLSGWGALATEAEDGKHGLAELKRGMEAGKPYKLVLLDSRMPGMGGFKVAEYINKKLGIVDITIMMLTSDHRSGDITRCRELGIAGYLVKPIKQSDLIDAITAAMGQAAHDKPPEVRPAAFEDLRALHILLVEDSADNRLLIQSYLKKTPYQLDIAENGEIAVEKFKSGKYDLVLMDVQMPVMDGYTATRAIRKWENEKGVKATPVIALTAYATRDEEQKSIDAGCTAHLTKPIKKAKLLEAFHKYTMED